MKKFAMLAVLLCLTALTVGCEKPVEKKAAPGMPAETEAKPADADMDGDKAAEPEMDKKADEADADETK